jgi:hypothetical protein
MRGLTAIRCPNASATDLMVTSSWVGPTPPEVTTMSKSWLWRRTWGDQGAKGQQPHSKQTL